MRTIETHKTNAASEALKVVAFIVPGPGGAAARYEISGFTHKTNPFAHEDDPCYHHDCVQLLFQQGDPATVGVNGITSEALLAILIDRHTGFANGPYPSEENAHALNNMQIALDWLHQRTRSRQARGVEGKLEK